MNQPLPISASVEVSATPEAVWEAVSDVSRMSRWSPECRKIVVLGSPKQGVGTKLLGINRRGWAVWPTTSKVVRDSNWIKLAPPWFAPGRSCPGRSRTSPTTRAPSSWRCRRRGVWKGSARS